MGLKTRISLSSGTESIEGIVRFLRCVSRNTMEETDLMKMGSKERRLPGFNCFLVADASVSVRETSRSIDHAAGTHHSKVLI